MNEIFDAVKVGIILFCFAIAKNFFCCALSIASLRVIARRNDEAIQTYNYSALSIAPLRVIARRNDEAIQTNNYSALSIASLCVIARRNDEAIQTNNYNESNKSSQFGFIASTKANFAALEPPFICFSLAIASLMETNSSKYPNLSTEYFAVKLSG